MKTMTKVWLTIAVMFLILAGGIVNQVQAQDDVKVCRNFDSDPIKIVIVAKSAQCPAGYH
jgi:hypothetical protein